MPPSTRLSGQWNRDGGDHPSNLDQILENFETFKRKHITQNRDIIKTNALAQLRIRELEARVQTLEAEKAEKGIEAVRLRASMARAEHASGMLRRAWSAMEKGFLAMAHCDEPDAFQSIVRSRTSSADAAMAWVDAAGGNNDEGLNGMPIPPHLRRGNRVSIDPSLLAGGVVRSVARPPSAAMDNVAEEAEAEDIDAEEEEHVTRHRWWNSGSSQASANRVPAQRIQVPIVAQQVSTPTAETSTRHADLESDSEAEGFSGSESSSASLVRGTASNGGVTRRRRSSKTFTSKAKSTGGKRADTPSWRSRDMVLPEPVTLDADGAPSPLPSPSLGIDLGGTVGGGAEAGLGLLHHNDLRPDYYDLLPSPTHLEAPATSSQRSGSRSSKTTSSKRQSQEKALRSRRSARRNSLGGGSGESARSETEDDETDIASPEMQHSALLSPKTAVVSLVAGQGATQEEEEEGEQHHSLRHTASIDSLSSYGDTEIEVSDDDEDEDEDDEQTPETPGLEQENDDTIKVNYENAIAPVSAGGGKDCQTPHATPAPAAHLQLPSVDVAKARTPEGRKRKVPASPEDVMQSSSSSGGRSSVRRSSLRASSVESSAGPSEADDDGPGGAAGRRVSGRVRKSINYALPKLNTKMRRPDPSDLIPVGEGGIGVGLGASTSTPSSAANRRRAASGTPAEDPKARTNSANGGSPPSSASPTAATRAGGRRSRSTTPELNNSSEGDLTRSTSIPANSKPTATTTAAAASERKATPAVAQAQWRQRGASPSNSAESTPVLGGGGKLRAVSLAEEAADTSAEAREDQTDVSLDETALDAGAIDDGDDEYEPRGAQKSSKAASASRTKGTPKATSATPTSTSASTPKASTGPVRMTLADFGLEKGTLSPIPSVSSNANGAESSSATPKPRGTLGGLGANGGASVKALSVANRNRAASAGSAGVSTPSSKAAKVRGSTMPASGGGSGYGGGLPHSASNPSLSSFASSSTPSTRGEKERPRTFSGATGRHLASSTSSTMSGARSSSSLGRASGMGGEGNKRGSLHAALTASVSAPPQSASAAAVDPSSVPLPPTPMQPSSSSASALAGGRTTPVLGPAGLVANSASDAEAASNATNGGAFAATSGSRQKGVI